MRWIIAVLGAVLGFSPQLAQSAHAQPRIGPKLVGMTHETTIKPARGFIDDPFAFDGAGGRLLYVNADSGYLAELILLDLVQGAAQLAKIDISEYTTSPVAVAFVNEGYFVVSRPSETDPATAFVLNDQGKLSRKFGPATDIALTERDGTPVVALYTHTQSRAKRRGAHSVEHRYKVELQKLSNGQRVGKARTLIADDKGYVDKLDFHINHWGRGYTRVIGIKGGTWDSKQNQRSPDTEAWYDMVTGVFEKRIDITDVMAHAHLMRSYASHPNQGEFLEVAENHSSLDLVTSTGRQAIALAQPFRHYDPGSLMYQPTEDGLYLFSLKIDPVNKDAVARKRADDEYLDLYVYRSGEGKATRLARYLLTDKKKRAISWRATEEYWILVPRLIGFSRGGKQMEIYKLDRKQQR